MSEKIYIGIDNGITGSIAIINDSNIYMEKTPVELIQDYTKKKKNISRLNSIKFSQIIVDHITNDKSVLVIFERPLKNPMFFEASISAARCFEAQFITIEKLRLPYCIIDSKEWQKEFLPKDIKGKEFLKKASMDIGYALRYTPAEGCDRPSGL